MRLNAKVKSLWVLHLSTDEWSQNDNKPENAFLVISRGDAMRERFVDIMAPTPMDLSKLSPIKPDPDPNHPI
jgi:hypothetical protein